MQGYNWLDNLRGDIRFSLRQLRQNAAFTVSAVLILALGIAASLAIFAFVDAALLKPLPYRDAQRLVAIYGKAQLFPQGNLSYPDYLDLKQRNSSLASLELYRRAGFSLSTPEGLEPVRGLRVSDGFFKALGVTPVLGRDFYAGEDLPGAQRSMLLSHGAWQRRFNGAPDALGKTIVLDRNAYVVVGVLPRDFHFAPSGTPEFFLNYRAESGCDVRRSCHGAYGIGRLKDGVSNEAALSNLSSVAAHLEQEYPDTNKGQGVSMTPLSEAISGRARPILLLLLGGAGLLLLIASVNVTGLLLVRSESRRREIAVRTALGASKFRILTQFVTEAGLLSLVGGVLGIIAAQWLMQVLVSLISEDMRAAMPYLIDLGLNARLGGFAALICILAVVLFTLAPGLSLGSGAIQMGLAEGSRGSSGAGWRRLGSKLVVVELATAMVLLVGACLLGQSLYRMLSVDLGFEVNHLITMDVRGPRDAKAGNAQSVGLSRDVLAQVQSLPGVVSAGISSGGVPLSGNGNTTWLRVIGRPWSGEHNETPERFVSATFFQTLGAKLLRGRSFKEDEDASKPRVAIVNQSFALKHFPGEDPIGKSLTYLSNPPVPIEIVGLVQNIRQGQLDAEIPPVLYRPFNQDPDVSFGIVVRASQAEGALIPAVIAAMKQVNPEIVTVGAATMTERVNNSPSAYLQRSSATLVGAFAAMALILGMVGLYGVVAYSVSQRTREIGVRMALGAQAGSVYKLILLEAAWLCGAGIGVGLIAAVGAASLMRGFLFGIQPWDPWTLGLVGVGLALAAMAASFIPARRAAAVSPVEALRAE